MLCEVLKQDATYVDPLLKIPQWVVKEEKLKGFHVLKNEDLRGQISIAS